MPQAEHARACELPQSNRTIRNNLFKRFQESPIPNLSPAHNTLGRQTNNNAKSALAKMTLTSSSASHANRGERARASAQPRRRRSDNEERLFPRTRSSHQRASPSLLSSFEFFSSTRSRRPRERFVFVFDSALPSLIFCTFVFSFVGSPMLLRCTYMTIF